MLEINIILYNLYNIQYFNDDYIITNNKVLWKRAGNLLFQITQIW